MLNWKKKTFAMHIVETFVRIWICSATVANLQAKVETLTTTNALLKEDMAISKKTLATLQDENSQLKKELGLSRGDSPNLAPPSPLPTEKVSLNDQGVLSVQNVLSGFGRVTRRWPVYFSIRRSPEA